MCGLLVAWRCAPRGFQDAFRDIEYRGPDASGQQSLPGCELAHHRLKILDLSPRANQPFCDAPSRTWIVYNGEIYNYKEIARRLEIDAQTECDTEIVLKAYLRLGPRCVELFNGMFAFVIYEERTGKLFAARDRLGIKPLFYARFGEGLLVSSEVAPIAMLTGASVDETACRQYLKFRQVLKGTIYRGIESLPPGCHATWEEGREAVISRYWTLPVERQEAPSLDELRSLVSDAVKLRRLSDVPVGSYLSGGLDSTIVAALASEPHTWTVGTPQCNEFPFARRAASFIGTKHHETIVQLDEFPQLAEEIIARRREPLSVPNEVLLYRMTRDVKKKNTVVLSGEGADELFFGYDRVFRWAQQSTWSLGEFAELYCYGSWADPETLAAAEDFMTGDTAIERVASFFQTKHLEGLLRRLDHATMRNGVEARVPFVDHRLVERMAGVSFEARMPGGRVKQPLKDAFADLIPREVADREKVGFPVPLDQMELPTAPSIRDHFGDPRTAMDRWLLFNLSCLTK